MNTKNEYIELELCIEGKISDEAILKSSSKLAEKIDSLYRDMGGNGLRMIDVAEDNMLGVEIIHALESGVRKGTRLLMRFSPLYENDPQSVIHSTREMLGVESVILSLTESIVEQIEEE